MIYFEIGNGLSVSEPHKKCVIVNLIFNQQSLLFFCFCCTKTLRSAMTNLTLYCIVFEHLYSTPHCNKPTDALLIRIAPRKETSFKQR